MLFLVVLVTAMLLTSTTANAQGRGIRNSTHGVAAAKQYHRYMEKKNQRLKKIHRPRLPVRPRRVHYTPIDNIEKSLLFPVTIASTPSMLQPRNKVALTRAAVVSASQKVILPEMQLLKYEHIEWDEYKQTFTPKSFRLEAPNCQKKKKSLCSLSEHVLTDSSAATTEVFSSSQIDYRNWLDEDLKFKVKQITVDKN